MREKLESLPLSELREIAKSKGIRGVTTKKKADLIEELLALGEEKPKPAMPEELQALSSDETASGILEVMPDGFGFIRCENYLPGENDIYVSPSQIRKFNLKTGDFVTGPQRVKTGTEKFAALLYVDKINDQPNVVAQRRPNFEDLTPIFPNERIHLETAGGEVSMRVMDLLAPIGRGQRGMIVSPPKAGKTTILKQVARAITKNHRDMHLIILLIDERPEEVTDIKESIEGSSVEVIYSTFDELPEHHKRVSEMVLERAKRLVEHGKDVVILLDSITRLARAYNLTVTPSGRTLSGGLDPASLYMPKRFFGAARNMREGGSLTILATALVETGSRMDEVIFEEFKGTGNMEIVLDRRLSERRIFPAIDILKSSTRRDDLLLTPEEKEGVDKLRRVMTTLKSEEAAERILDLFGRTRTNREFLEMVKKMHF
ncbi:MAG: transcription termination factor Rho [Lachnospiraceae bacterium]|nr:transcription termination factor Rho [Lachnospiraceae bacterium]